jgi:hypothetical protein
MYTNPDMETTYVKKPLPLHIRIIISIWADTPADH